MCMNEPISFRESSFAKWFGVELRHRGAQEILQFLDIVGGIVAGSIGPDFTDRQIVEMMRLLEQPGRRNLGECFSVNYGLVYPQYINLGFRSKKCPENILDSCLDTDGIAVRRVSFMNKPVLLHINTLAESWVLSPELWHIAEGTGSADKLEALCVLSGQWCGGLRAVCIILRDTLVFVCTSTLWQNLGYYHRNCGTLPRALGVQTS